ncbi:hypothetical protein E3P86_02167 [Wallemia ichthyophaga]|uniref:Homing endonuclease LAGLIDADG domain-containing protein n=1 Tax=Wallemia ichthyophaga TaxID=245174 RepID=A0A4T0J7G0_WALIC|nr:hypothetical protein E3P86_02167 [Wallemia ichthyophaga]
MAKRNASTNSPTPNDPNVPKLKSLASYIAGLFEGDGHIWIPSTTHAPSGKFYSPRFMITFALKDLPLAQYLSKGGVQIRIKDSENACVLTINSIPMLILVVKLLNGLLRTPKIEQFNALIYWLKANGYADLDTMPVDTSSLLKNGWLAGFIDADGGFKIRITQRILDAWGKVARKGRVACSFVLEQLKYLDTYPLLSSKYLDYQNWRQAHILMREGQHLTPEGLDQISKLKSEMNNYRTQYTYLP